MVRFLINIPETLKSRLQQISRAQGCTLNGLIRQILWDWVKRAQWEEQG